MKTIEELFEKQEFEEIVDKYKDSNKYEEILYVLSSLISLGKINESYDLYKNKEKIMEERDFLASMNYFLLILALLDNQDLIDKEMNRIKNLPYQSQEIEQFINDLDNNFKKIKEATEESNETEFNYVDAINSEKEEEVIKAIHYIHANFKDKIEGFNVLFYDAFKARKTFDYAKNLLLIELIDNGYNKNISFYKNDKFYFLKPSELTNDYKKYESMINKYVDFIKNNEKNTNIINDIIYYFMFYIELNIPEFLEISGIETVLYCSIKKAHENIKSDYLKDELLANLKINKSLVAKIENFIAKL